MLQYQHHTFVVIAFLPFSCDNVEFGPKPSMHHTFASEIQLAAMCGEDYGVSARGMFLVRGLR